MLAAGFTFFTIDPSDHVDQRADTYGPDELATRFASTRDAAPWHTDYLGKSFDVPNGPTVTLDEPAVRRCVVKYGRAIDHAVELAEYIAAKAAELGRAVELEISVDETDEPTTVAEHYRCIPQDMSISLSVTQTGSKMSVLSGLTSDRFSQLYSLSRLVVPRAADP